MSWDGGRVGSGGCGANAGTARRRNCIRPILEQSRGRYRRSWTVVQTTGRATASRMNVIPAVLCGGPSGASVPPHPASTPTAPGHAIEYIF